MKKSYCLFVLFTVALQIQAQKIVNIVYVRKDGVTDNLKKATGLIIIKKRPDDRFERLDYGKSAPLIKQRTFSDSTLKELSGPYSDFFPNGFLERHGDYEHDLRTGWWSTYNDSGKLVLLEKYSEGLVVFAVSQDTVKKKADGDKEFPDEREAEFPGKERSWARYLINSVDTEAALDSKKGGNVHVNFMITTGGQVIDVNVSKSVEFVLDEEALRVIRNSPDWIPAFQNGKNVNAYRRQPITFAIVR